MFLSYLWNEQTGFPFKQLIEWSYKCFVKKSHDPKRLEQTVQFILSPAGVSVDLHFYRYSNVRSVFMFTLKSNLKWFY